MSFGVEILKGWNVMQTVSELDNTHYRLLRENIDSFIAQLSGEYDCEGALMLDVAPQDHAGAVKYFKKTEIETLDIDPSSGADYIADLCDSNEDRIANESFDMLLLSEVLEHTLRPFDAIKEVHRLLKKGGHLFLTVPFNFRIHGPLPDCWRFTEHGLRAILKDFDIIELTPLEDESRFLMPIAYTVIAQKPLHV